MTRSFVLIASLAFIAAISCATAGGDLRNFDGFCDCGRMKLWQDEYLVMSPITPIGTAGGTSTVRGWIGNDIFRVIVAAEPRAGLTGKTIRKVYAKNTAIQRAWYKTADLLIRQNWTEVGHWADAETGVGYPSGVMSKKEIAAFAKTGRIVCENFDAEDKCLLIYEVQSKCLRYRVKWELKGQQDECR